VCTADESTALRAGGPLPDPTGRPSSCSSAQLVFGDLRVKVCRAARDNATMPEQSIWMEKVAADPGHSAWYVERFRSMARAGDDLAGEARLVDAMLPRGALVLDAGCGPGRVGGALSRAGHHVVGVDVDPALIEAAEQDHPGPSWLVGDLAELDLPSRGLTDPFDAVVCAGNVMPFLAPSTRGEVLARLRAHLAPGGRVAVGFAAGRGYEFDAFYRDADDAGLAPELALSTWDLRPFTTDAKFLVSLLRKM
jgi:SAM-dependent methyltransferase